MLLLLLVLYDEQSGSKAKPLGPDLDTAPRKSITVRNDLNAQGLVMQMRECLCSAVDTRPARTCKRSTRDAQLNLKHAYDKQEHERSLALRTEQPRSPKIKENSTKSQRNESKLCTDEVQLSMNLSQKIIVWN